MSESEQPAVCTTDGLPAKYPHGSGPGAPQDIDPVTGQHRAYWVLCDEEREKGFVRPVRDTYCHVGPPGPLHALRDLTVEEHERYDRFGYVKFEAYPSDESSGTGCYWTQPRLDNVGKGCRSTTTMGQAIAETYARNPAFYGSTFCVQCHRHLPVGKHGEFVWLDGSRVGT